MSHSLQLSTLISQVEQLAPEEQLTLLQKLSLLLKGNPIQKKSVPQLSALSGLGSTVWQGQNEIDTYLDEERQW